MSAEQTQSPAQVASVPQEVTGQPRRVVVGGVTWRDTFAALKHRNFRLFFAGQFVSLIGGWMQSTAQGWLVYQLTGSKVLLGTVAAAGSLPLLLLSVWGGSVADRHPKRTVIFFTQTGMMLLAFAFAALVWNGHIQPWHILLLAVLGGVAMAFDMPARQAFTVEMTSREDLMNAISLNSSIFNGARVVGPSVAGFLMAHVGMAWCFLLNGLSFIAVITGLLMMRLPKFVPPAEPHSAGRHVLEGFAYVAGHRRVRLLLLFLGVVGIFGWWYSVLLPAYATDILYVGERGYGALLSANGFGALLGALTVATYGSRVRPRLMILGGLWLFSAMLVLLAVVRWYPLVLACMAVGGWGMLLYFATTNTLVQTSVSDAMRGRVMGIRALVFGGMMPPLGDSNQVCCRRPWACRGPSRRGGWFLRRCRSGDVVGGAPQSFRPRLSRVLEAALARASECVRCQIYAHVKKWDACVDNLLMPSSPSRTAAAENLLNRAWNDLAEHLLFIAPSFALCQA